MKTEAYFSQHCDYEHCSLGEFNYTCPVCGKFLEDYDVWWEEDDIYKGTEHKFDCENCHAKLVVKWDAEERGYFVYG